QGGDAGKLTGGYSPLEMEEKNVGGYLAIEDVIGSEAKIKAGALCKGKPLEKYMELILRSNEIATVGAIFNFNF
ncbi:hypothetical protein S83_035204, partial [Arachis hypogaea]